IDIRDIDGETVMAAEAFLEGIKRAGTNVAIDNTDGADRQCRERLVTCLGVRLLHLRCHPCIRPAMLRRPTLAVIYSKEESASPRRPRSSNGIVLAQPTRDATGLDASQKIRKILILLP